MAQRIVKLPDVGEGVASAEVVEWSVAPGDVVVEDQMLGAVMTDKATVEIPSPVAGVVISRGAELGNLLAVGAEFVVIEEGSASGRNVAPGTQSPGSPAAHQPIASGSTEKRKQKQQPNLSILPKRQQSAAVGETTAIIDEAESKPPVAHSATTIRPLAAPAVRHRAQALGIDLAGLTGSGAQGQIQHADLDTVLQGSACTNKVNRHNEEVITAVPLVGLRRQIATKMTKSKQTIPHFTYVEEVDVVELEKLRQFLNQQAKAQQQATLTLLPFIVMAIVRAIADFPQMNARFDEAAQTIQRHSAIHVGVAAQTAAGLMVPVLRHAQRLNLHQMGAQIVHLAAAARDGSATHEELIGSTITISSLGVLGGIVSTPVINHPEVAIIAVNRIVERQHLREGFMTQQKLMNLSSSFDHRAVDGYDAANFVQRIKALLEHPAAMFL